MLDLLSMNTRGSASHLKSIVTYRSIQYPILFAHELDLSSDTCN